MCSHFHLPETCRKAECVLHNLFKKRSLLCSEVITNPSGQAVGYPSDEGVDLKFASGEEGQVVWTHKLPAQNVLSCFILHYGVP